MHLVPGKVVRLDGEEGAGADMERHGVKPDAAGGQIAHQACGEMQSGGRRRHRAFGLGEHGLIIGAVARIGRPARRDIGRQRHLAALRNGLVQHRPMEREPERHLAGLALRLHGGVKLAEKADPPFVPEPHHVARLELAGGLDQRLPARAIEPLDQRRLDPGLHRSAKAAAGQLRRDYLGVVDDELIAGPQEIRKIANGAVFEQGVVSRPHHQQPRGIARARRPQRDAIRRQGEIEEVGAHLICNGSRGRSFKFLRTLKLTRIHFGFRLFVRYVLTDRGALPAERRRHFV